MIRRALFAGTLVLCWSYCATADQLPNSVGVAGATITGVASLSVSGTSANVPLPGPTTSFAVVLTNDGGTELFFTLGTSNAVLATTANSPLPPGTSICVAANSGLTTATQNAYVAAITAAGTSTLRVQQATACPPMTGSGAAIFAATALPVKSGSYVSAGNGQFALAVGTNTALTVPSGTLCAEITVEGANVRRTSDGTSATSSNGTLIESGAQWQDCGPLAAYKFTAVSGSPTLDVEYFK